MKPTQQQKNLKVQNMVTYGNMASEDMKGTE